jgi:S-phase kinase-associated protein 1
MAPKIVVLVSSDDVKVELPVSAAMQSTLLRALLEDGMCEEDEAPEFGVPSTDGETLNKCVEYLVLRDGNPAREIPRPLRDPLLPLLDEIDNQFIAPLDEATVQKLLHTANFLNAPSMKALLCARCADWMMTKTVDEIRTMFGVNNDFTAEEIAALKKEHVF